MDEEQYFTSKEKLIEHLRDNVGVLSDEKLVKAFEVVDRKDFVPVDYLPETYEDYALPIGCGQTISQPTTVAFMLEKLDVHKGQKVLDVGSGSGWTTALLATLVGQNGSVIGVEKVPELVKFGQSNLAKYDFSNAEIFEATDTLGKPDRAPYDRILVSAEAKEVPEELFMQLSAEGKMIIPIGQELVIVSKNKQGNIEEKKFPGFVFVPLN